MRSVSGFIIKKQNLNLCMYVYFWFRVPVLEEQRVSSCSSGIRPAGWEAREYYLIHLEKREKRMLLKCTLHTQLVASCVCTRMAPRP